MDRAVITPTVAGITELLGLEWSGPELTWDQWLFWFVVLTTFSVVTSVIVMRWVMRDLPTDYFVRDDVRKSKRSAFTWLVSNAAGVCVLVVGLVLLVTPGQGILLIVSGVIMIDFPGKHRFERRLASWRWVLSALNWMRLKLGVEPFDRPSVPDSLESE